MDIFIVVRETRGRSALEADETVVRRVYTKKDDAVKAIERDMAELHKASPFGTVIYDIEHWKRDEDAGSSRLVFVERDYKDEWRYVWGQ